MIDSVNAVHTVLGSVDPADLGATLMHEHALLDWSELHGTDPAPLKGTRDRLIDDTATLVGGFLQSLPAELAPGAIVEATPIRVGRYPLLLRDLALRAGIHLIAATGFWGEALAPLHPWARRFEGAESGVRKMAGLFVREIEEGMEDPTGEWGETFTDVKAGIIKIGTSARMRPGERLIHRAAALASRQTGCPITTHTNFGGGLEEAELLIEEGVQPARIIIGHQGHLDNSEQAEANDYHERLAELGCFVQFDRVGHDDYGVDKQARQIVHMIRQGSVDRILVSHDRASYHVPNPERQSKTIEHWESLGADFTTVTNELVDSLLGMGATREEVEQILVRNPRRALAF